MKRELLEVTRQLALAARAGLPLGEALRQLPPDASRYFGLVSDDLVKGDTLAQAVARYPRAFSPFYANMIEAAEAAERPGAVLTNLSRWLEASDRLQAELRAALLYPWLLGNALGVFLLCLGGVLPLALPGGFGLGPVVAALGVALVLTVNGLVLRGKGALPGLRPLRRRAQEALWARALGTLLAAGVPLPRALQQAAGVVTDPDLQAVGQQVSRGSALAEALRGDAALTWALRRGGEELPGLLLFAAEHLERQVEREASARLREGSMLAVAAFGLLVLLSIVLFWAPFYWQVGAIQ